MIGIHIFYEIWALVKILKILTGFINTQPEDDVIFVLLVSEFLKSLVLYSGALASATHTRSGIGYKLKEFDASGQYVGQTSRGTVIRCDWLSNVFIYCKHTIKNH